VTIETDIIVVGAGPCGCFSALTAAKLGTKVAVFEEHPRIGVPTHCAGHLSLKGLERLGLKLPSSIIENTFKGAVFFSPSGRRFSVRFPFPVTCVVNRELFDQYLANIASNRGAQFLFSSKVQILLKEQKTMNGVLIHRQSKQEKVMTNMIIDAEGVSSTLLKSTGLRPFGNEMFVKAVSAEVDDIRDVEDDCVEVYLGSEFADGFYAWIVPKRNDTAKIGLATKSSNPKKCLDCFVNDHKVASSKLRKSKIKHVSFHSIPLGGSIPKTYTNGFLAVGDVASQVKPTTGGGVVMGLTCARIAGKVAMQAVREDNFTSEFLRYYEKQWKQKIGFDLNAMLFARKLLNRISDREIDKIFAVATALQLNNALIRVKDVDFQGRELIRLARSPSALVTLAYFFFLALL
jgi:digeranylgeranylglycerophospholipid reductase